MASIQRGLQHIRVIAGSLPVRSERERALAFISLLRQGSDHLRQGGLPRMMHFLDDAVKKLVVQTDQETALRQADAVAALYSMKGLRHCMRRSMLRYVVL